MPPALAHSNPAAPSPANPLRLPRANPGTNGPKRAQAYGIKGPNLPNGQIQISGIKGNHSDHIYFVGLFPRMKLNHSTA